MSGNSADNNRTEDQRTAENVVKDDDAKDRAPDPTAPLTAEQAAALLAGFTGRCAVADIPMRRLALPDPSGIDLARVEVAGSLMSIYLYGMRLMFLPAVDRARELLDTQDLCLERDDLKRDVLERIVDERTGDDTAEGRIPGDHLRNALYCWPYRNDRVTPLQRATLVARVLGQPHPDVPEELVDTEIQPLLRNLFDVINSVCDPGPFREKATPATMDALRLAREAVRHQLSRSVTEMVALQVRDLQRQLEIAVTVLGGLAGRLASPCRAELGTDIWASLDRLVGPQLRADKIDAVSVAHAAQAWQKVFTWLADRTVVGPSADVDPELCRAVSRLQTPRRIGGCACTATAVTAAS